jgi:hypothetical protein
MLHHLFGGNLISPQGSMLMRVLIIKQYSPVPCLSQTDSLSA